MGLTLTPYDIIKAPLITEKSTLLREKNNQYVFYVHPSANKIQIRDAVQTVFKVTVEKVRVSYVKGKMKRMG
ncbi:MAG TPA: 50S ribosomal protein L23, partial [bacterium]|nr:50S ribosomal protein L23 [bacterium]